MAELGLLASTALVVLLVIVLAFVLHFVPIGLYVSAMAANAPVHVPELIGMRLRGVEPASIVKPRIAAAQAGFLLPLRELEAHHHAGGNVSDVVTALLWAARSEVPLTFDEAAAIDLAGEPLLDTLRRRVESV